MAFSHSHLRNDYKYFCVTKRLLSGREQFTSTLLTNTYCLVRLALGDSFLGDKMDVV